MSFIAEQGVILTEVNIKDTPNGHKVVEVPVIFNDYERGIGNVALETKVVLWNEKAQWVYDQAQKHTKKDGTKTNGKGMPMFFVGNIRTNKYTNSNQQTVRENIINAVEASFSEIPVMSSVGVIGKEVELRTVNTKHGQTVVADVPVYFNGFYPSQGSGSYETFVTLWGDKAQWLYDQAQKHTNKDGNKTGGKGMRMKFICYLFTEKYMKDGQNMRIQKAVAADVKFASSVFGSNSNSNSNNNTNSNGNNNSNQNSNQNYNNSEGNNNANQTNNSNQSAEEKPHTSEEEPNEYNFDVELEKGEDSNDILEEFSNFFKEINGDESETA